MEDGCEGGKDGVGGGAAFVTSFGAYRSLLANAWRLMGKFGRKTLRKMV